MTHEQVRQALARAQEKYHHELNKQNLSALNKWKHYYNISLINISISKLKES